VYKTYLSSKMYKKSIMAYHFTRSRARGELEGRDVERYDVAPAAPTSPPSVIKRGG